MNCSDGLDVTARHWRATPDGAGTVRRRPRAYSTVLMKSRLRAVLPARLPTAYAGGAPERRQSWLQRALVAQLRTASARPTYNYLELTNLSARHVLPDGEPRIVLFNDGA